MSASFLLGVSAGINLALMFVTFVDWWIDRDDAHEKGTS